MSSDPKSDPRSKAEEKPAAGLRIGRPSPRKTRTEPTDGMTATQQRSAATLTDDARHRLLVNAITDYAITMLDASGIVSSWNLGAKRFKGYEQAEILGQHFAVFYTEEDRRNGLPARALETAARDRFEDEGWRVRKDGSRFWAHVAIDAIRDDGGNHLGFAEVTCNLSERQSVKDALRRSEGQFRHLVQSVREYAICLLDTDGRISSWNAGAQRIKGYDPDEVIGRHFSIFFTQEDQERGEPARTLEEAVRDGRFETEGWRVRKNGDLFLADVTISPVSDDNGSIIGFAQIIRDMTVAKQVQLDLDRAREELLLAQRMEAVGQLTGGVAHDFNTIFREILRGLETAQRSLPEDPDIVPHVENAMHAARRGRALTQRMMALAERQELIAERVDLPVLLHGMADLLQRTMGPSVVVELRFPSTLAAVNVDPNQLALVIVNLLRNSRDAMPDGGTIIVDGREDAVNSKEGGVPNAHRFVCLSVTDRGDGMDGDTLKRATEPFFTTKGVGKGTGLGLSMAQSFAAQSGGQFVLRSKIGDGTVAELWLPVAAEPARTEPDSVMTPEEAQRQPASSQALVVLAVDDDRLALMNTTTMLNRLGHRVYTALSGQQALDVIRREAGINLLIIDHALPDMTGADLAEAVRTDWPLVPILFATPLADASLLQVAKPFRETDLSQAITRVVPGSVRTAR